MAGGLTRRMLVASGLLGFTLSGAFAVLLVSVMTVRESARLDRDSVDLLATVNLNERLIIDLETGARGFLLTRDERFLTPWTDALAALPAQTGAVQGRVADKPEQKSLVGQLTRLEDAYIADYSIPLVAMVRANRNAVVDAAAIDEGRRRIDEIRGLFDRLRAIELRLAGEREGRANDAMYRATTAATSGLAGSVLLVVLFTAYLTREIVRPVRRVAAMADALAGGDLRRRMPVDGVAEIGALEHSFNTMAASLEHSDEQLSRLLAQQAALRRVATLVARGVAPAVVFAAVTEEVGRLLGADGTRLLRYESDDAATVVAAWSGSGLDLPIGVRIPVEGDNVPALVLRTGAPARLDSLEGARGLVAANLHQQGVLSVVGAPAIVEGRLWGVMTALSTRTEPFAPDAGSRIADFTDLVATAIANTQARSELSASRARVVTATDQTRRRIERDLHDGVQQRLVSLALNLGTVVEDMPEDLAALRVRLGAVADGLTAALDDLREIARGIHPAILSEGGLRPALRALARRSAVPVELDVPAGPRLAQPIEVAAYYVVAEALTNTAKHAGPAAVSRVRVRIVGDRLRVHVQDDGTGGADPARGSGLVGIRDRVEALGGTITISSPPGRGTSLRVELPVESPIPGSW